MDDQIQTAFPGLMDSGSERPIYEKMINKMMLQLNFITGEETDEEKYKKGLDAIDEYFYNLSKPKVYWGSEGFDIQFDKEHETLCITISQHLSMSPKKMTTFEFFNTVETLKKQFEANK